MTGRIPGREDGLYCRLLETNQRGHPESSSQESTPNPFHLHPTSGRREEVWLTGRKDCPGSRTTWLRGRRRIIRRSRPGDFYANGPSRLLGLGACFSGLVAGIRPVRALPARASAILAFNSSSTASRRRHAQAVAEWDWSQPVVRRHRREAERIPGAPGAEPGPFRRACTSRRRGRGAGEQREEGMHALHVDAVSDFR